MNQTYIEGNKKDLFFDWSVEISCVLFNNARICQKAPSGSISLMRELSKAAAAAPSSFLSLV